MKELVGIIILKQHSVSDIAFIGYLERPEIDVLKASVESQSFQKLPRHLIKRWGYLYAVKKMFIDENFNIVKIQDLMPSNITPEFLDHI